MKTDYQAIKEENERKYGTDIGRIAGELLANLYEDRTHFIYELLQNTEDALRRRPERWNGSRSVVFKLSRRELRVSHFGVPFSQTDVQGICGVLESTKEQNDIGCFGIGFKSVYAYTNRPRVHSGDEHFAIENYVWPAEIPSFDTEPEQTVIVLPLRDGDHDAVSELSDALQRLGPRTLLFLKEISEIAWVIENGSSGRYRRNLLETISDKTHQLQLISEEADTTLATEERWLRFSRAVGKRTNKPQHHVEIAFKLDSDDNYESVKPLDSSQLAVFFPTIVPTDLGFLVHGPYQTTPSRDNIKEGSEWNEQLIQETAKLLSDSLRVLRNLGLLDVKALMSLPLDREKFRETRFAPLFDHVRDALASKRLLPASNKVHVSAGGAKIAETQKVRDLLGPSQLMNLLQSTRSLSWLTQDIRANRTAELYDYLTDELGVEEISSDSILAHLTKVFLEAQSNKWIAKLYEFLHGQPALMRQQRFEALPIIRLEDGKHVCAWSDGQPQAFLPSAAGSEFPTVKQIICAHKEARNFLVSLGLSEPDPVDEVIRNVLPRYAEGANKIHSTKYEKDIKRIIVAFGTDSKNQREKLLVALRDAHFLKALDPGSRTSQMAKPSDVYLATKRLKGLFDGVAGVLLIDDTCVCLRGEVVRELLEACGASRTLRPIACASHVSRERRSEMRRLEGSDNESYESPIQDFRLHGLKSVLDALPTLDEKGARSRAALLWEALCDVVDRRGESAFSGTYQWFYYRQRSYKFDSGFVSLLKEHKWIPDANGNPQEPHLIIFEDLEWKSNPFLLSKINFRAPVMETLAREAGFEPGALDLLKKCGLTSEAELIAHLGLDLDEEPEGQSETTVDDALKELLGDSPTPTPPAPDPDDPIASGLASNKNGSGGATKKVPRQNNERSPGNTGSRPFISYVGMSPDDIENDPAGLDHDARMALEEKAIAFILEAEPQLQRTPIGNPGYDLFEAGAEREPRRLVEVKAMARALHDRPVGLSVKQFETARQHGDSYWLYIVEHAGTVNARILQIQNPVGKSRTFTLDHGWLSVAEVAKTARKSKQEHS